MVSARPILAMAAMLLFLLAGAAVAEAAAATAQRFDWSLVSRFGGDADGDGRLDADGSGLPRELTRHPVLLEPSAEVCAAARARWQVDGRPRAVALRQQANGRCRGILVLGDGTHRVEVDIGTGFAGASIPVRDRLVVALGDSVASGEGNPVAGPAARTWLERRCHRSVSAGFEQAARLVAEGIRRSSVTFVSLACSGATVKRGLLGPYRGIERGGEPAPLRPQVDRLARLAQERVVDGVLVSVGANDAHFGDVVRHCASRRACSEARFDPARTGEQHRADEAVAAALDRLAGGYADLARALAPVVGERSGKVLISEYFDPVHDQRGEVCRRSLPGVTRDEAQWAYDSLMQPLNREVAAAATTHGWTLVDRIAADFRTHGYCAGEARWVRTLGEAAATQTGSPLGARLGGTLHPNERGHLAIADRVAPALARTLGFGLVARRPAGAEDDGIPSALVAGLAIVAVLVALWLVGRRLRWLLTPSETDDPVRVQAAAPKLPVIRLPKSVPQAVAAGAGTVLTALLSVSFVALVGAAILWVRFTAARVPADQAVAEVARGELVATGAQALIGFALLGLVAFVIVWLLDGNGQAGRASRRGLGLLIVLELLAVIFVEDFSGRERFQLIVGFFAGAVLLYYLTDRALYALPALRTSGSLLPRFFAALARVFLGEGDARLSKRADAAAQRSAARPKRGPRLGRRLAGSVLMLWRLVPLAALGGAIYVAVEMDGRTRWLALALIFLAAVLFVAPGGIVAQAGGPKSAAVHPARVALAAASLACLVVLLWRDETWLVAAVGAAVLLAAGVLVVAGSSGTRFAPYGIAVLASVPMFGAAATLLAAINSPQLQPVAAVSADGKKAYCGVYIAESDGRLWLARVDLAEAGNIRRPRARKGRLGSVARDELAVSAVGPLQPVASALDQAVVLRDELIAQHGDAAAKRESGRSCSAAEIPPPPLDSPQRHLAERFQPELVLHRRDGFWPVAVSTIFAMQDRRARTCRRSDVAGRELCLRLSGAADLPWSGGEGEWIEFPAADDRSKEQAELMVDALGSEDPARSSREYFLVSGGEGGERPVSVQYWFFYTFNYQPLGSVAKRFRAGYHEGDFESVGVVLSARTHQPRYVYMARHADEGRVFVWDEEALERSGEHPTVYVAQGSHASYESCSPQARFQAKRGLIDDRPACDEREQLHIAPESTPLTDLSRVSWGCWRGLFGHRREAGYNVPYLIADAPRSPLWQQRFGGERATPCRGVEPGPLLQRRGEEVLPAATAARLREGAGRIDTLVDECADWEQPAAEGAYVVACDQEALRRYVASGLEDLGPGGVRIDAATGGRVTTGPVTLPAVRRTVATRKLDAWRISAVAPSRVTVFASCRQGGRDRAQQLVGRFAAVSLTPGRPLRIDDRVRGVWRLRTEDGAEVARTVPERPGGGRPRGSRVCG